MRAMLLDNTLWEASVHDAADLQNVCQAMAMPSDGPATSTAPRTPIPNPAISIPNPAIAAVAGLFS